MKKKEVVSISMLKPWISCWSCSDAVLNVKFNQGYDSNLSPTMIFLCELADWAVVSKFLVIFIHNLTVIEAVVAQL